MSNTLPRLSELIINTKRIFNDRYTVESVQREQDIRSDTIDILSLSLSEEPNYVVNVLSYNHFINYDKGCVLFVS